MERGHAFGVELASDVPMELLVPGPGPGRTPVVPVRTTSREELDGGWPTTGSARLLDRRRPDGTPFLAVDRHPEAGWRIDAPGHGVHRIAADGAALDSAPDVRADDHHLLVSQVLPTLATVNGLACLHAAAVVVDGQAVGLLGPSGIGKTSLSACMAGRGALFLADDVAAVALDGGGAWAQAGARSRRVVVTGMPEGSKREEPVGPGTDEAVLRTLVWLERTDAAGTLSIDRVRPDVGDLLGAAFLPHIEEPAMLVGALDVAADLAERVVAVRARVPDGADVERVAEALLEVVR